jgi:hypothetical protein
MGWSGSGLWRPSAIARRAGETGIVRVGSRYRSRPNSPRPCQLAHSSTCWALIDQGSCWSRRDHIELEPLIAHRHPGRIPVGVGVTWEAEVVQQNAAREL